MSPCIFCDNSVNTRKKVTCSVCTRIAHGSCINEATDIVNLISVTRGLVWRCDQCLENSVTLDKSSLNDFIAAKVNDAVNTLTQAFDSLKAGLVKSVNEKLTVGVDIAPAASDVPMSYSEIVNSRVQPAVIIKPKNPNQSNSQTKSDMLKSVNPADSDFQLAKVKHVRNGGVLVSCKNKSDTERLMKIAQENLAGSYEIKETFGVRPRIRVAGISERFSAEVLLQVIRKCNTSLVRDDSDFSVIKIAETKRNGKVFQAVLQVDKNTYNRVIKAGNLFIGYDSCPVYDAIEAIRCFNCNEFHHSSKKCSKSCSCPRCGDNHTVKDCNATALCCSNCMKLKTKDTEVETNHAAWDILKCKAYNLECEKMRKDILSL